MASGTVVCSAFTFTRNRAAYSTLSRYAVAYLKLTTHFFLTFFFIANYLFFLSAFFSGLTANVTLFNFL